jgi:hypothetical protein
VTGPTVTWQQGGPHISKVYGVIFEGPFAALQSQNTPPGQGMVYVEGTNLAGQWRIGSTNVPSFDVHGDGTLLILYLPAMASSGPICGTATNGVTACTPTPFVVFGGPTIADLPTSPLSIGTTYTIEGINLLPPPEAAGLTYQFQMGNLDPICNLALKVLDHTEYHIVFRIGDPAVPLGTGCNVGPLFDPTNQDDLMFLEGAYGHFIQGMWIPQHFYLAKPMP